MKLSQVLLTVVLVAAGIFAYDLLRAPVGGDADPTVDRVDGGDLVPVDRDEGPAVAPPSLDGTGDDAQLAILERRLVALEALLEASGLDVERMLEPGSGPGTGGAGADTMERSDDGPKGEAGTDEAEARAEPGGWELNPSTFTKEELRTFRQKLQWVERQRKLEKAGRDIWTWLNRQGVKLEPGQQRGVVIHALRYQALARKLREDKNKSDEAKKAEAEKLGDQFRDQLFDIVPSTEALRIIDALDRQQAEAAARRAQND